MTSRERWTIYPLLFLALGLAFRAVALPFDKAAVQRIEAGTIICGEIVLAADDGTKLVHIGRVKGAGGGRIEIFDGKGTDAIAIGTTADAAGGAIEFFDAAGKPAGRVGGDEPARLAE
jgi:hypothetical protein